MRTLIPERERRAYKVDPIIETLADDGSVTFLRQRFAPEMVTALARIEGRAVGVIADSRKRAALSPTSAMIAPGHHHGASNLGQMLNKLCLADGVQLVNIVRSAEQEAILEAIGAKHIVNSTAPDFLEQLTAAVSATGATLAFDAVGGGPLAGQILVAMEWALTAMAPRIDQYGSRVHKQVYTYGHLDRSPTSVPGTLGMAWGIGGLARIGPEATQKLRERVANEISTTFASSFTRQISLAEALDPETIRSYQRWQRARNIYSCLRRNSAVPQRRRAKQANA